MNQTKKPVGRPKIMRDGRRVELYLDEQTIAYATRLGNGNISLGVRLAIESRFAKSQSD